MSYSTGRPAGVVRMILGVLLATVFVLAFAVPASAHTALQASSPKDGGKTAEAPSQLVLQFTEPILTTGYRIIVRGPDGQQYQAGAPQIVDTKLTQPLSPLGAAGEYAVEFRVVASDGHPLTTGMKFTLTKPGPASGGARAVAPAPLSQVPQSSVNDAPSFAPWIAGAAVVIFVGGAVLFGRRVTHGLD